MKRTSRSNAFIRRCARGELILYLCLLGSGASVGARDVFVVLSGGVSPFENNYSQYLQARALNHHFEAHYPPDSVWTFFGAGNVAGEPPDIADVRRKIQREGLELDSWFPGALPRNRPARREIVLRALREEILPAIAAGGTLYLFVGDHGSRPSSSGESEIDLWELERDPGRPHGWSSMDNTSIGVTELRRTLVTGIGKGRVVFCMTQCHSGGFHALGIPDEPEPNPRWFTTLPEWALRKSNDPLVFPRVAGFAATDQFSPAAGCDPDPKSDEWAGYERFVPESLLGLDLLTLQTTGPGLRSLAEAHVAATLRDFTIDKPSSTSDEYLKYWARLLDVQLDREPNVTARVRRALDDYQRTLDGARPVATDSTFRERQKQFAGFVEQMSAHLPGARTLLVAGTRRQLEDAIGITRRLETNLPSENLNPEPPRPQRRPRGRGASSETRRLWRETVQPAWKIAVQTGQATNVSPLALPFERHLLRLEEEKGRSFWRDESALEEEVFWFSGYGHPQTLDPVRAEANARWGLVRRSQILAWARTAGDETVRAAALRIAQGSAPGQSGSNSTEVSPEPRTQLSQTTAAARTLFYRRVLGAWQFLLAVNERPALARVRELIELERTPLPRPK